MLLTLSDTAFTFFLTIFFNISIVLLPGTGCGLSISGINLFTICSSDSIPILSLTNLFLPRLPPNLLPNNGVCSVGCDISAGCVAFLFLNLFPIVTPIDFPATPPSQLHEPIESMLTPEDLQLRYLKQEQKHY